MYSHVGEPRRKLLGIDRANPVPEDGEFSEETSDMLERTKTNPNAIIYGTFHTYPQDVKEIESLINGLTVRVKSARPSMSGNPGWSQWVDATLC